MSRPVPKKYGVGTKYDELYPASLAWITEDGRHDGKDYLTPVGVPIENSVDGIVYATGYFRGYGNAVFVKFWVKRSLFFSDTYRIVYAHLSEYNDFKVGQKVRKGTILGLSGATGWVSGAHLHVQVEKLVAGRWVPVNPDFVVGVP